MFKEGNIIGLSKRQCRYGKAKYFYERYVPCEWLLLLWLFHFETSFDYVKYEKLCLEVETHSCLE